MQNFKKKFQKVIDNIYILYIFLYIFLLFVYPIFSQTVHSTYTGDPIDVSKIFNYKNEGYYWNVHIQCKIKVADNMYTRQYTGIMSGVSVLPLSSSEYRYKYFSSSVYYDFNPSPSNPDKYVFTVYQQQNLVKYIFDDIPNDYKYYSGFAILTKEELVSKLGLFANLLFDGFLLDYFRAGVPEYLEATFQEMNPILDGLNFDDGSISFHYGTEEEYMQQFQDVNIDLEIFQDKLLDLSENPENYAMDPQNAEEFRQMQENLSNNNSSVSSSSVSSSSSESSSSLSSSESSSSLSSSESSSSLSSSESSSSLSSSESSSSSSSSSSSDSLGQDSLLQVAKEINKKLDDVKKLRDIDSVLNIVNTDSLFQLYKRRAEEFGNSSIDSLSLVSNMLPVVALFPNSVLEIDFFGQTVSFDFANFSGIFAIFRKILFFFVRFALFVVAWKSFIRR